MNPMSNTYYSGINPIIVEKAAIRGSCVHSCIEDYEKTGKYEIKDIWKGYLTQYKIAKKVEDWEVLELEQKMTNGEYAGTFDCMANYKGKKIFIDYKTSSKLNYTLVQVQFAFYMMLAEHNKKEIEECWCLHLSKTGYKFEKIEPRYDIAKALLKLYNYLKESE